jgi:hypothetical protein
MRSTLRDRLDHVLRCRQCQREAAGQTLDFLGLWFCTALMWVGVLGIMAGWDRYVRLFWLYWPGPGG